MYRFCLRAAAGTTPGFTHVADLYKDGVHLKSEGKYLETVSHYAAVFHDNPHGAITSGLRFWRAPAALMRSSPRFSGISFGKSSRAFQI